MTAKHLHFHDDARERILRGADQLARAVRVTLGPRGRTVILEREFGGPQIVNSGVLVARAVELEDPAENLGAQLLREVAARTSEQAGDGTTPATVLAHAMLQEGQRYLAAGLNPVQIKRGIEQGVEAVGGVLLLGSSETIGRFDDLFETTDARLHLYRSRQVSRPVPVPDFSFRPIISASENVFKEPLLPDKSASPSSLQVLVDWFLMQQWAPPSVLVNDQGDILYINGRTGRFLEPAAGKANWNVHVMAREGLRAPLAVAMRQAAGQRTLVEMHEVPLDSPNGLPAVDLSVQSMDEVTGLKGMLLIVFKDLQPATAAYRPRRRTRSVVHQELEAELQRAREEAQSLREEMRASQEQLQAANEELQSTNEELQSTNEELNSSKEEMQAVNAELRAKLDDLAVAQSDMRNLLNSTEIATLFLDKSLHVRRFTERARKVISLREGDVGRPLSDLTTSLNYRALEDDVRDMLRTLVVSEKQVRSREGLWYAVRIMPYRTQDDVIEGAVVTFVDISAAREAARDAGAGQGAPSA